MDLINNMLNFKYKILIDNNSLYNENKPFFSIIMLTFNSMDLVDSALKNIYNQAYNDFELILINDGSVDDTDKIVYKNIDDRLIYIKNNKNVGVGASREIGINLAKGKYIIFVDVDDIVDDKLLLKLNKELVEKDPDLIIFGFEERYVDKNNKLIFTKKIMPIKSYENFVNNNRLYRELTSDKNELKKNQIIDDIYINDIDLIKNLMVHFEDQTILGYPWNKCYKTDIIKSNNVHFSPIRIYEDILFNVDYYENIKTLSLINNSFYTYINKTNQKSATKEKIDNYYELSMNRIKKVYEKICKFDVLTKDAIKILRRIYVRYSYSYLVRLINNKSNNNALKSSFDKITNSDLNSILFNKNNAKIKNKNKFISLNKIMEYAIIKNKYSLAIFIAKIISFVYKYCYVWYLKVAK